jgi:hypothetical protein
MVFNVDKITDSQQHILIVGVGIQIEWCEGDAEIIGDELKKICIKRTTYTDAALCSWGVER